MFLFYFIDGKHVTLQSSASFLSCEILVKSRRRIFTRTSLLYVRVFAIANPSVCSLSSVTSCALLSRLEFSAMFLRPFCTLAIRWPAYSFYGDRPRETPPLEVIRKRGSQIQRFWTCRRII